MDSERTDIEIVCQAAIEWASEYGFVNPDEATLVYEAVERLKAM